MRHYYFTRSGRLRRKDNTLLFELSEDMEEPEEPPFDYDDSDSFEIGEDIGDDLLGDLSIDIEDADIKSEDKAKPAIVKTKRTLPIADIDSIWVFRELDLNARVLNFMAQKKIPVHFFNYYGFYSGSFYPREYLQAGFLLVKQVKHYELMRRRLLIAKELVNSSLHNILRNLRYYGARGIKLQEETESVQSEVLALESVSDINELMGCEGRARAAYYRGFTKIIKPDVEFEKRVRRPPNNMVNAMISFTNGLVYTSCLTQIYRSQLNPTISFLHEPGYRRFSLALDLAEIFKPLLADRITFKLFNNRQLSEKHFAKDLNFCYLKDKGRKIVLQEWDRRINTTIQHRRLKRKVSYERLIRLECYKLVKHLTEVEPYKAFKAWW